MVKSVDVHVPHDTRRDRVLAALIVCGGGAAHLRHRRRQGDHAIRRESVTKRTTTHEGPAACMIHLTLPADLLLFGPYQLDIASRQLQRDGAPVTLP